MENKKYETQKFIGEKFPSGSIAYNTKTDDWTPQELIIFLEEL